MSITKLGKIIGDWNHIDDALIQKISNLFGLKDCINRLDTQNPTEVKVLQLDSLEHHSAEYMFMVNKIVVHLTDWEPGHFYCYGKDLHTGWTAGEVYSYNWYDTPHASANAGDNPRITLEMIGTTTAESKEFLARLKRFDTYHLELKENSW